MIILDKVTAVVPFGRRKRVVLSAVSLSIPVNRSIALLGPFEEDNQLLIEILAGTKLPHAGVVLRKANVSFPVGTLPGYDKLRSFRSNIEHVARLYGANLRETTALAEHVLNVGPQFAARTAPTNKADIKLLQDAAALCLPFDVYVVAVDRFSPAHRCWELFRARQRLAGMIIATANPKFARDNCDMAMVLCDGALTLFERLDDGLTLAAKLAKEKQQMRLELERLERERMEYEGTRQARALNFDFE